MEESLLPLGFHATPNPQDADLIIVNTCHIRAKAEDKLFSELGRLHIIKNKRRTGGRPTMIIVAGCVGQALGADILKRAPYVDVVVGPQTYHTIPETVMRILWAQPDAEKVSLGFPKMEKFDELPHTRGLKGPMAFLSIQEGCNKFCRYCVVPYTRGPEYSRPLHAVLEEAKQLIDLGAKEITLLGQNVNAYHGLDASGKESSLGRLIYALAQFSELKRLRYTTSHPRDVDQDLLCAHRDVGILMPFLHLPVQSGSDKVLARMNRQYTQKFYLETIDKFLDHNPKMAFSSDFIVGYPGESDEDFQETCDLVNQVRFAQAFSFKYSPRPGTPAAMVKQLDESVKDGRLQALNSVLDVHRLAFNQTFLGQTIEVLVESVDEEGSCMGRSQFMHGVHFTHPFCAVGDFLSVRIEHTAYNSLKGIVVA
jgi:tRNA-2-methylthio-N6-dimethylallyladenosine synthase